MKNINFFSTVIITLLIALLNLTGCNSDDGNPISADETALVGTWDLTSIDITTEGESERVTPEDLNVIIRIVFDSDHSWDLSQTETTTNTEYTSQGSWSLSGSNLVLNATGSAPTLTLQYSASNNALVLEVGETVNGVQFTYYYNFSKR